MRECTQDTVLCNGVATSQSASKPTIGESVLGISKLVAHMVNDDQARNLLADILYIYHTFVSDHCDVTTIP